MAVGGSLDDSLLEGHRINPDINIPREGNFLTVDSKPFIPDRVAENGKFPAQGRPCHLLVRLRPQEGRQRVAALYLLRNGQVDKDGRHLAARQRNGNIIYLNPWCTEQVKLQLRHLGICFK